MAERDEFVENDIPSFGFDSIPDVAQDLDFTPTDEIIKIGGDIVVPEAPADIEPEVQESTNKLILDLLKEKIGLDYNEEDFEDTEEYLKGALDKYNDDKANTLAQEKVDAKLENLPDVFKQMVGYHNEGIDVTELINSQDRLAQYKNIQSTDLDESEDLQEQVIQAWLSTQNYSKEELKEEIQSYKDAGTDFLNSKSKIALRKLIETETKYNLELNQQAEDIKIKRTEDKKESLQKFEKDIMGIQEIVPGVKISDVEKKKLFDILTKPVGTDKLGRPLNYLNKLQKEDPMFLAKTAYFGGILKWDFSNIKKNADTSALNKLKYNLTPGSDRKASDKTDEIVQKLKKIMRK